MNKLTIGERRLMIGCLAGYLLSYSGRLNLSAALPALKQALELSDTQSGMFQTVFALIYAAGQMANGMIADRVNARLYVAAGLMGSALCNLGLCHVHSYPLMLGLWALNGACQSMLWTPIIRLLSRSFEGYALRKVCSYIAFAPGLSHFLAWGLAGLASLSGGWYAPFGVGAMMMCLDACIVLLLLKGKKAESGTERERPAPMGLSTLLLDTGFAGALLLCIANGFIRDGVIAWTPTIVQRRAGELSPVLIQMLVPGINLFSLGLGSAVMRRHGTRPRAVCGVIMLGVSGMCALTTLAANSNVLLLAALMGLSCLLLYGMNPTLVSMVPIQYASIGRVGMTAGLIDCFIYVGSSLSGVLGGLLQQTGGEVAFFASWSVVGLFGVAGILWAHKKLPGSLAEGRNG